MTKKEDARLLGRHPEFSRQSRRPGVGALAVDRVAEEILKYLKVEELFDVPTHLNFDGRKPLVLGRYMRGKLRLALGLPEGAPDEALRQAWIEQVLPLLQMAKKDEEAISLSAQVRKANETYALSLEARAKLYEREAKL